MIIINISLVISFLSLSKNGMNISYCYNKICIGPADSLLFLVLIIYYIIIKNRNINKNLLISLLVIMLIMNIIKIYNTQKKLHNEDMFIKNSNLS